MRNLLILIFCLIQSLFFAPKLHSQTIEDDIRKLFELSGSEEEFYNAIDQIFTMYIKEGVVDMGFVEDFKAEIRKEGMEEIEERLIPVYKDIFTHKEIKALIQFYESKTGRMLIGKQGELMNRSMAVGQEWGRELSMKVLEKMGTHNPYAGYDSHEAHLPPPANDIEILASGHSQLVVDYERFSGEKVLDFGDLTHKDEATLGVILKNVSEEDFFLGDIMGDEILSVKVEEGTLKPGEEREVLLTWNARCFEGRSWRTIPIARGEGGLVYLNLKGFSEGREIEYEFSSDSLKFNDESGDYSAVHEFYIKNTGRVGLVVGQLESENPAWLLSVEKKDIGIGEEVQITAVYSKVLAEKYKVEGHGTNIRVNVRKCSSAHHGSGYGKDYLLRIVD